MENIDKPNTTDNAWEAILRGLEADKVAEAAVSVAEANLIVDGLAGAVATSMMSRW